MNWIFLFRAAEAAMRGIRDTVIYKQIYIKMRVAEYRNKHADVYSDQPISRYFSHAGIPI